MTAKRSPLNNRVVRSTPGGDVCADIDPEGVAHLCRWGTLSECIRSVPTSAGPSDTAVIERRRFQRHFNRTGRYFSCFSMLLIIIVMTHRAFVLFYYFAHNQLVIKFFKSFKFQVSSFDK